MSYYYDQPEIIRMDKVTLRIHAILLRSAAVDENDRGTSKNDNHVDHVDERHVKA